LRFKLQSLRLRLLALAAVAVTIAMVLSAIGLVALFGRHVERSIGQQLDTQIVQLAGNLRFDADGKLFLDAEPGDPRFEKVFGGLYWQITDVARDVKLRSVSLWDSELALGNTGPASVQALSFHGLGPDAVPTLVHQRSVILTNKKIDRPITISVAINTSELEALKTGFGYDLVPAIIVLGALLLGGLWWQVTSGLAPFASVSEGVKSIRDGQSTRLSDDVPTEIKPLVTEVNLWLGAQENLILRARDRAADLAHGLKTPLTALTSDVARLRAAKQNAVANDIEEIAQRMRQIVERELARSRLRHARSHHRPVSVSKSATAIIRTLMRTPQGEHKRFENRAAVDALVAIDGDDLNDILGNLLENAARAAKSHIMVETTVSGPTIIVTIADDGPGVSEDKLDQLTTRGVRLDSSKGGAGLGLSLVTDILEAYGSQLHFERSDLGGLEVSFTLPQAQRQA
jgi:signal transduction histidine kinase